MTTTTQPAKRTLVFENSACSRCGGSGRYSYYQLRSHTCFKCRGRGTTLTKRGKAAQAYYRSLLAVPATELQVGDVIKWDSMSSRARKSTVTEAVRPDSNLNQSLENGEWVSHPRFLITTQHGALSVLSTTKVIRYDAEIMRSAREQALAYQANLTKAGTIRKARTKNQSRPSSEGVQPFTFDLNLLCDRWHY